MEYVLGLSWIGTKERWACAELSRRSRSGSTMEATDEWRLRLRVLGNGAAAHDYTLGASKIVLDAPLGLYGVELEGCYLRGCDKAAKKWIGPDLQSSVLPVPYQSELDEWEARRYAGEKQRVWYSRGLLSAINSAKATREDNPNTLESHPELVFAALLGKPLPAFAAKSNLFGSCVRLGLIAKYFVKAPLNVFASHPEIPSEKFIDALGMAVVAVDWADGKPIEVLRESDGRPEPLSDDPDDWLMTMALPHMAISSVGDSPATEAELTPIAMNWLSQGI